MTATAFEEVAFQGDLTATNKHLYELFSPAFVGQFPDARVEIAYGFPAPNRARTFPAHDLKPIAEFAATCNASGFNIYVGVHLRKPDAPHDRRTDKNHFLAAQWAFTEHDDGLDDAVRTAQELNIAPSMLIGTGTTPHPRGHLYYLFNKPVTDVAVYEAAASALIARVGGDAVGDAGRIMRLAGMVNRPTKQKCEAGYTPEVVTVTTVKPTPHAPEKLAALGGSAKAADDRTNDNQAPKGDSELEALLEASRSPHNWHNSMRNAVATMVGRGFSDAAIRLSCAPYCNGGASDPDLAVLIKTARDKYDKPSVEQNLKSESRKPFVFESMSDVMAESDEDEYLVEKFVPKNGVGLFVGKWGTKKTFVLFDIALRLGYGFPDWHGYKLPGEPRHVLIIAREGRKAFKRRLRAFMQHHGLDTETDRVTFMRSSVNFVNDAQFESLRAAVEALGTQFAMVIVDTVGRAMPGADMSKEFAVTLFMERLQQLGELSNGVGVAAHHENKNGDVNGSMYFQNSSDFMHSVVSGEGKLNGTIKCIKTKDDEQGWTRDVTFKVIQLPDGKSSLCVESVSSEGGAGTPASQWPPNLAKIRDSINEALLGGFDNRIRGDGPLIKAVQMEKAWEQFKIRYVFKPDRTEKQKRDARAAAWKRGIEAATVDGLIGTESSDKGTRVNWFGLYDRSKTNGDGTRHVQHTAAHDQTGNKGRLPSVRVGGQRHPTVAQLQAGRYGQGAEAEAQLAAGVERGAVRGQL
jgi:hypothetical protein